MMVKPTAPHPMVSISNQIGALATGPVFLDEGSKKFSPLLMRCFTVFGHDDHVNTSDDNRSTEQNDHGRMFIQKQNVGGDSEDWKQQQNGNHLRNRISRINPVPQ